MDQRTTPPHEEGEYRPHAANMRQVYVEACEELLIPHPSIKLPDWPMWNEYTGGFRPHEFSIFCGPTGAGKTTWLANVSAQLLKQNVKHFVMSVECGHRDYMKRIMSVFAGYDLNTGDAVNPLLLESLHARHRAVFESDAIEFSLYENRVKLEYLLEDLRYMNKVKGCKVAMIDNLNFFMEVTRSSDTLVEMDRVIHELIIFCKSIDMHIIMVMHPKKTDGGRITSEFDIKGSSTAVQEAQNVFLFNRLEDAGPYCRELKMAKLRRRGHHQGKTVVFESLGTQYNERRPT
jgi:twinkle protein